jgi:hypothetical protein
VQAVVMVTPVLMGNGHFWKTVNKKRQNRLSPKFAQVGTVNVCKKFGSNL